MDRFVLARYVCRLAGATFLLALAACAIDPSVRPASPAEQCRAWGYAPDDPECLRVFRRDRASPGPLTGRSHDG